VKTLQQMVSLIEREDAVKRAALHLVLRRDRYGMDDPIELLAYEQLTRDLLHLLGVAVLGELRVIP
jgi:hypothetical protein